MRLFSFPSRLSSLPFLWIFAAVSIPAAAQRDALSSPLPRVAPPVDHGDRAMLAGDTILVAMLGYDGTAAPSGVFKFQVDPGMMPEGSCSGTSWPLTCSASYATGSVAAGAHTVTVAATADGNDTTPGGTGTDTSNSGYVWLVNATGSLVEMNEVGASVNSGAVGTSGAVSTLGGAAIDGTSHVWSVSNANNTLNEITTAAGSAHALPIVGVSGPVALAVDGENGIWVANSGNGTVSLYGPATANLPAGANYGGTYESGVAMQGPSAIAVDKTGGIWVANKAGNSVTHIIGGGFPTVTPIAAATAAGTQGVEP